MAAEGDLIREIQLICSHGDVRLFRNQVGEAWQGTTITTPEGILLKHPRRIQFGLAKGSSDLIGWKAVAITPDMVGQSLAVFVSVEVKTPRGSFQTGQRPWLNSVEEFGGISGVARSLADAQTILGLAR